MAGTVTEVSSEADFHKLCSSHTGLTCILMWASWHPPSVHLTKVLEAVASEHKAVRFGKVNTDVCSGIASSMGADQVPFVAFCDARGQKLDSLAGADPPKLVEKVKALSARPLGGGTCKQDGGSCGGGGGGACSSAAAAAPEEDDLNSRLQGIVNYSPIMLFMKGSKAEPFCGFSKQAIAMLNKSGVDYSTFDILQDEEVRQGLKDYANWKTYPQLYIKGELLGGLDIMKEMEAEGSFQETLEAAGQQEDEPENLTSKLKGLINKAPVVLFMKGNKEQPFCGFSRKAVALLQEHSIDFDTFDILGDEEVRQGLKEYSNWKTYPQLYIKGELMGGIDIMKEMEEDGSLMEAVG